jgi:protein SCO1/2
MRALAVAILVMLWPAEVMAGLTEQQIGNVALAPTPGAELPTGATFKNLNGTDVSLGEAIGGRPTLLLPADFTCAQICGPALTIVANALQQTGLVPGQDYSLIVLGIDPRDDLEAARRFVGGQVGGPGVTVLSGTNDAIHTLTEALAYRFQVDSRNDAIAHPAAFVTLTPDGHVLRAFSSLALQPLDLRLGLLEAGRGEIGGLPGRLALLCYGFDPVHGIYTRQIAFVLQLGGALTLIFLTAAIAWMSWRTRRRASA